MKKLILLSAVLLISGAGAAPIPCTNYFLGGGGDFKPIILGSICMDIKTQVVSGINYAQSTQLEGLIKAIEFGKAATSANKRPPIARNHTKSNPSTYTNTSNPPATASNEGFCPAGEKSSSGQVSKELVEVKSVEREEITPKTRLNTKLATREKNKAARALVLLGPFWWPFSEITSKELGLQMKNWMANTALMAAITEKLRGPKITQPQVAQDLREQPVLTMLQNLTQESDDYGLTLETANHSNASSDVVMETGQIPIELELGTSKLANYNSNWSKPLNHSPISFSFQLPITEAQETFFSPDFLREDELLENTTLALEKATPECENASGLVVSPPERGIQTTLPFRNIAWNRIKQAAGYTSLSLSKVAEYVHTYFSKPQEPISEDNVEEVEYVEEVAQLPAPEPSMEAEEEPKELALQEVIAPESTDVTEELPPQSTPQSNEIIEQTRNGASEEGADETNETNETNENTETEPGITKTLSAVGGAIGIGGILATEHGLSAAQAAMEPLVSGGRGLLERIGLTTTDEALEEIQVADTLGLPPEGELNIRSKKRVSVRVIDKVATQEELAEKNLEQSSVGAAEALVQPRKTLAQSEETRTPAVVVEAKTEEGIFMSAINYIFSLPSLLSKTALSFVSWTVSVLFDLLNFILPHWSYKQKD